MLKALVAHPTVVQLGWTLLHSIWQGVALAGLLYLVLLLAGNAQSSFRHAAAATFLLVWLALPVVTFMTINNTSGLAASSPFSVSIPLISSGGGSIDGVPSDPKADNAPGVSTVVQPGEATDSSSGSRGFGALSVPALDWLLPYMAVAWLVIASLLSLRLAGSLLMVQRLRALGTPFVEFQSRIDSLAGSMGLKRSVRLLRSSRVDVPTVLGFLRPVILLPASAVTGLTREQLDLILAHELAHVRRHDYLLNILQGIAETLLFFHPFTWWLSRILRLEREQACDALAIDVIGTQRLALAEALTRLEGLRSPPQPALAANGDLTIRVRRLLGYPHPVGGGATGTLLPLIGMVVVSVALSSAVAFQPPQDYAVPWVIVGMHGDASMRINNVTVHHADVILRRGAGAGVYARRGGQDVVVPWPNILAIDASPDVSGEMRLVLITGEVLVIPEGSIAFEGTVAPGEPSHTGFISAHVGEESTYIRLVFPSNWPEAWED